MLRFAILGFCLITVSLVFNAQATTISEDEFKMYVPMKTLVLKPPSSVEPKRNNVDFPHAIHFSKVNCQTCHHNWNGITNIQSCMTSGCHDSTKAICKLDPSKDITSRYYKKAYHSQCIGCHKALKVKFEKIEDSLTILDEAVPSTGPTGCVECHPK